MKLNSNLKTNEIITITITMSNKNKNKKQNRIFKSYSRF